MLKKFLFLLYVLSISAYAISNADAKLLSSLESNLNSSSRTVIYKTYNTYKSLYIKSLMRKDYNLKKSTLNGLIQSAKILGIDKSKYEKEYTSLYGKRYTKTSSSKIPSKKLKIIKKEEIKKPTNYGISNIIKVQNTKDKIAFYFNRKLTKEDIHRFELKNKNTYKDVYDIRAVLSARISPMKLVGIERVRMAQNSAQKFRVVFDSKKPVKSTFEFHDKKLIIHLPKGKYTKKVTLKKHNQVRLKKLQKPRIIPVRRSFKGKIIVIDPGHGGKDPGAIGGRKREKDIVLKIGKYLRVELKKRGYKVYMTRDRDRFITLRNRTRLANKKKADLFVSIHANAVAKNKSKMHGIETYFLMRARSARAKRVAAAENQETMEDMNYFSKLTFLNFLNREKMVTSQKLAIDIQKNMLAQLKPRFRGVQDKGVREAPFWVLVGAQMPSVLIEAGYISHPRERKKLVNSSYQKRMAKGIADGLDSYFLKN